LPIADFQFTRISANEKRLRLRVTRVMAIDALGQQSLATALTASGKGGASTFGPHPCPKTVLTLASSFGWLVSAFHKAEK